MSTSMANSLSEFSRDLVLRDGAMLRFRALRPSDRDALNAFLSRCSPDSIRYRFLHSIKARPKRRSINWRRLTARASSRWL